MHGRWWTGVGDGDGGGGVVFMISRPVYIESRVCVVKEAAMCSFEY